VSFRGSGLGAWLGWGSGVQRFRFGGCGVQWLRGLRESMGWGSGVEVLLLGWLRLVDGFGRLGLHTCSSDLGLVVFVA
jgi:hypothetical protein